VKFNMGDESMARRLLALAFVFIMTSCQSEADRRSQIENSKTIRIGTDATYPPFETVDPATGQVVGFDAELMRRVFAKLGYEVEFTVVPFDGIVAGLTTGKYDAIVSAFTITPERQERVAFSVPYYDAGQTIAVPLSDTATHATADLQGKRIGVQLGTTGERLAKGIADVEVFSYDNIGAAFIDMDNGKLDAVINDKPTSERYIALQGQAKLVGELLTKEQYGVAFRKEDQWLLDRFNTALQEFMNSPEFAALNAEYITHPADSGAL
jgi:ABC-type amino acid transport substrate-binding protein